MIQTGSKVEWDGPAHLTMFEKHRPYTVKSVFENPNVKGEILVRVEEVRLPLVFIWYGPEMGTHIKHWKEMKTFRQAIQQLYSYELVNYIKKGVDIEQDAIDKMIEGAAD